jgi:hypothetical protein
LCLGDGRTKAILGSDHALLQISSITDHGLVYVHASKPAFSKVGGAEYFRSLVLQCQGLDDSSGGWGLSLVTETPDRIDSGFINYRWPVRRAEVEQGGQKTLQMITTYAEKGRIVQVLAVASPADHTVGWKLGGKVQFQHGDTDDNSRWAYYTKIAQEDSPILTVDLDPDSALDIQVFVDGARQFPVKPVQAEAQAGGPSYASFSWTGDLRLEAEKVRFIVAIFSFRERNKRPDPDFSLCPTLGQVKEKLGLLRDKHPLAEILTRRRSTVELVEISCIATHHVEQLLSVAAVSVPEGPSFIMDGMAGDDSLSFETLL